MTTSKISVLCSFVLIISGFCMAIPVFADHTPEPSFVMLGGSFQNELGCPGDWQPDCISTRLSYDAEDGVWQEVFNLPAGDWEYKAALNQSWTENYGVNAQSSGLNISLSLAGGELVKFYYDHESHWITDNVNALIAVAVGSFQDELGCNVDWSPSCLRSWLQDPDGDGVYVFKTRNIPAGNHQAKVAIDESLAINYGKGGVTNGADILFNVPVDNAELIFEFDTRTRILSISIVGVSGPPPVVEPIPTLTIQASLFLMLLFLLTTLYQKKTFKPNSRY